MRLRLRFPHSEIEKWAAQYSYASDAAIEDVIAPAARRQGYLTRDQFLTIAEWKTARSRSRCRKNDAGYVKEVTSNWPTASVILHFCDRGRYPIVDVRALWSLGVTTPPAIDFLVWMEYTRFLRGVSADAGVSMRTLDRALWQYSKVKG
jgi:hypothetical protein